MHRNEIVFSQSCLDVGLCVGESDGIPVIRGRYSQYSPQSVYGGVQYISWMASGIYCSEHRWDNITNETMSVRDVMNVFGIENEMLTKTPCAVEEGGWDEMLRLMTFLADCGYVKRGKNAKLASLLMSMFTIKNKV